MDAIMKAKREGAQSYKHLKQFFEEPESANIDVGYYVKCNKDAWMRGFMAELRKDNDRFPFLKRVTE